MKSIVYILFIFCVNLISKDKCFYNNKDNFIQFTDGTTESVISNFYEVESEIIDSIVVSYKSFKGIYKSCGKSPLNTDIFRKLKKTKLYNMLLNITTAYEIETNNRVFYFSANPYNKSVVKVGDSVLVKGIIFHLYSNKKLINNILIIDSVEKTYN